VLKKLFSSLFLFFICFVVLQVMQRDLGELVSMMEHNLGCSLKTLRELCESQFYKGIGKEISREQRDEEWKSYMMLAEENRG